MIHQSRSDASPPICGAGGSGPGGDGCPVCRWCCLWVQSRGLEGRDTALVSPRLVQARRMAHSRTLAGS
ncbi:MAG: hypothetical protein WBL38_01810, partial [Desulfomonilia bacterium]|nr:hypothetical protein [Deltaproteobacteria bacterium]